METLTEVVGDRSDAALHDRLDDLDRAGRVVRLTVRTPELGRRRFRVTGSDGREYGVALPRGAVVRDGSVLLLEEQRAILVETEEPDLLVLRPTSLEGAIQLGWHAGHLHWRVRPDGDRLTVVTEGPRADYLARIRPLLASGAIEVAG